MPLLIINLASSDMLYGLFLVALGIADIYYKGNFMLKEDAWERSLVCSTIDIMATVSLDMSLCIVTCLALDQAHVILAGHWYGYIRYHISSSKLSVALIVCWTTLIACSLAYHLTASKFGTGDDAESLCLGTILDSMRYLSPWRYLTLTILAFRLLACVTITACYIAIAKVSLQISGKIQSSKSKRNTPYIKTALIVFTNVTVTLTLSVIGILTYLGQRPKMGIILWVAAILLPINALINPIINSWNHILAHIRRIFVCIQKLCELLLVY